MARILVIDDDEYFRATVRDCLLALGHEVIEADDGQKGLNSHAAGGLDLVITDLVMPGKEGIETIIELRKRDPGVLILAMSAGGIARASDYLRIASKVGADRVLEKPFSAADLAEAVGVLLNRD